MNLKDIKQYSREAEAEIRKLCESIHPKLRKRLQYLDFYDETLNDNSIQLRLDSQVYPLIVEYKRKLKELKEEYLTNLFEDFMELENEEYGYDLDTGSALVYPDAWKSAGDFLPVPELDKIYHDVLELHSYKTNIKGFWEYDSYSVSTPNQVCTIDKRSSPEQYIRNAQNMMGRTAKNAIYAILDASKTAMDFGYEMHIPPIVPYEERNVPNHLIVKTVERHKKLKDFLEGVSYKNCKSYDSRLVDGIYKFTGDDE